MDSLRTVAQPMCHKKRFGTSMPLCTLCTPCDQLMLDGYHTDHLLWQVERPLLTLIFCRRMLSWILTPQAQLYLLNTWLIQLRLTMYAQYIQVNRNIVDPSWTLKNFYLRSKTNNISRLMVSGAIGKPFLVPLAWCFMLLALTRVVQYSWNTASSLSPTLTPLLKDTKLERKTKMNLLILSQKTGWLGRLKRLRRRTRRRLSLPNLVPVGPYGKVRNDPYFDLYM